MAENYFFYVTKIANKKQAILLEAALPDCNLIQNDNNVKLKEKLTFVK